MIRNNAETLGLEPGVFDLAFEGFWDLYTFHHAIPEISAKKLQTWINKIRLQPNEMTGVPATAGEPVVDGQDPTPANEPTEAIPAYEPIKAVCRIRIAKKLPDPVEDDDGNMVQPEYQEEDLEEIAIDDKCLSVTTNNEAMSVFCINQAAGRVVR